MARRATTLEPSDDDTAALRRRSAGPRVAEKAVDGMTTDHRRQAEKVVQRQFEAMTAKDIDALIACWTPKCSVWLFPDRSAFRGIDEVRQHYAALFGEPDFAIALRERVCVANIVCDKHTLTRTLPEGPAEIDVTAMYEVEGGKITQAWLRMIGEPRPTRSTAD